MASLVFVRAPAATSDAGELLSGLAAEAAGLGAEVEVREGDLPSAGTGTVAVFAPGDHFGIPGTPPPDRERLAHSVAVCLEPPTGALDPAYLYARRTGGALTPDAAGADLLRRHRVPVAQVPLGLSSTWNGWKGASGDGEDRGVDVACLARRGLVNDALIASFGRTLWRRRSRLIGAPPALAETGGRTDPPPALGEERRRLLRATRVLLVGLGDDGPEVERLRALQAAANGAAIVASHGTDLGPLQPGRDFAPAAPRNLALVADRLLRDPDHLWALRDGARSAVDDAPGLRPAAESLLALADRVARGAGARRPTALAARAQAALSSSRDRARRRLVSPPNPRRVARKREALGAIAARRAVSVHSAGEATDPRQAALLAKTPAYDAARPRVTVCVPLYEHADAVERALASVAGSELGDCELLVLDDASEDGGPEVVRRFLDSHPWLPALLLGRRVNQGLGRGRTDMARLARAEELFMLDADNEVYPPALGRLADALDEDPGAAFAYSLIEAGSNGRPRALLSALPWDPQRLRRGNYIDAMAMIRRQDLLEAGGYTEDLRLHGWEDFDLWCRFAAQGRRGLLVPEVLCRYSLSPESMISLTNLDSSEAWALLRELYPGVLGGAPLPEWPPEPPDLEL